MRSDYVEAVKKYLAAGGRIMRGPTKWARGAKAVRHPSKSMGPAWRGSKDALYQPLSNPEK